MNLFNVIVIVLLIIACVLLVILLVRMGAVERAGDQDEMREDILVMRERLDGGLRHNSEQTQAMRVEFGEAIRSSAERQSQTLMEMSDRQARILREMNQRQSEVLSTSIERLQTSNENRLNAIQGVVDEKLDKTLNERLDTNFSKVTEQLSNLYRSLGELKDLSGGVADLNRTLSNVKTRGNWGEVQLQRILDQTMSHSQYDTNVATKRGSSDRVEFAIRFPSQDPSEKDVYLPVDAKFPADIYNRIAAAAENNDRQALDQAKNELRTRIRQEASTISAKYLDPPYTTNFAFMYLPTEGLYAEVLRLDGLTEECQNKGVVITGPTTITAVLNSLQVGFRNVALSKKSMEVMKLLEAVKGQVIRMDEAVAKAQKKLTEAVNVTEDLQKRTRRLGSRMRSIADMDAAESDELLGLDETIDIDD